MVFLLTLKRRRRRSHRLWMIEARKGSIMILMITGINEVRKKISEHQALENTSSSPKMIRGLSDADRT